MVQTSDEVNPWSKVLCGIVRPEKKYHFAIYVTIWGVMAWCGELVRSLDMGVGQVHE